MQRNVILEDQYGDHHRGVERTGMSDEPPTVAVNGTVLYTTTWVREGWEIVEASDWFD